MAKNFIYDACLVTLATLSVFHPVNSFGSRKSGPAELITLPKGSSPAESNTFQKDSSWVELSWTKQSAAAAEIVASYSCSGHGNVFLDTLFLRGSAECECNTCYEGSDCSVLTEGCTADVALGDPLFLEPYWMNHKRSGVVTVSGWHRLSYNYPNSTLISASLEKALRDLHLKVGNANTQGRNVVFGAGSTPLMNAAIHALALDRTDKSVPAKVVATAPTYPAYQTQTEWFRSVDYEFAGDTKPFVNSTSTSDSDFIEIVTSPVNPTGFLSTPALLGQKIQHFYDYAYYWPHYTPITAPADEDVMLFTLSKSTGHAGTRFGWAWVKDERVYQNMANYVRQNTYGVGRDTQLRALKIIQAVTENIGTGDDIFEFGYETMKQRWAIFSKAFERSTRFSVQNDPAFLYNNNYFKTETQYPTHAYAWVKCESEEDKDCYQVFKQAARINGQSGVDFLADASYVRFSLLKGRDDFNLMMQYLTAFLNTEENSALRA